MIAASVKAKLQDLIKFAERIKEDADRYTVRQLDDYLEQLAEDARKLADGF